MKTQPGYYVTCIDEETDRRAALAGPFETHEEALAQVDICRRAACEKYPAAHWYLFGTAHILPTRV
jgi:hypothetical protein